MTLARAAQMNDSIHLFVTIDHEDFSDPIYLVNNTSALTRASIPYLPFNLNITPPNDKEGGQETAQFVFDAVDLSIITKMRSINTAATVNVVAALASNPDDTPAYEIGTFLARPVGWNQYRVTGELAYADPLDIMIPSLCKTPENNPGVF
jgi:hypothetical protein